jgi:cell wall assembly regulator SMI1
VDQQRLTQQNGRGPVRRGLDPDPSEAGTYGQVFQADQGLSDYVIESSRLLVLSGFAARLEAGKYVYDSSGPALNFREG